MTRGEGAERARAGDVLVVEGHRVGAGRRVGEVVEVLGEPAHVHYRVRWEDGHESLFYPEAGDATVKHHAPRERASAVVPYEGERVLSHEP